MLHFNALESIPKHFYGKNLVEICDFGLGASLRPPLRPCLTYFDPENAFVASQGCQKRSKEAKNGIFEDNGGCEERF